MNESSVWFKLKYNFCKINQKMPYEEVYFQRLKEDNPEDFEKLQSIENS